MKKTSILFLLIFAFACSSNRPAPSFSWRISRKAPPNGNTVSIMPIDVRVSVTGKANNKDRHKIWKNATRTTLSLMRIMPDFLAARSYRVKNQILWSGRSVSPKGVVSRSLSQRELARSIYALSWFAGNLSNGPLRHKVTPGVFNKLSKESNMTLYVANWYSIKVRKTHELLEFLKGSLIVVGVAIIVIGVVVGILALGGKDRADNGRDLIKSIGGIFKFGGRLFLYGAKGLAKGIGSIFAKTLVRTTGKVALHTARIATKVSVRSFVENGPLVIDLPLQHVQPAYTGVPPTGNIDTINPFMGVENGISSMNPTNKGTGYYLAFILVNNSTGAVVWDGRIWFPQGSKINNAQKMIKEVFNSMPHGTLSSPPVSEIPVY
jgi:hypothetical protein